MRWLIQWRLFYSQHISLFKDRGQQIDFLPQFQTVQGGNVQVRTGLVIHHDETLPEPSLSFCRGIPGV